MSLNVVSTIYLPTAGYALGLNLKPHTELDLDRDFDRVLNYLRARRLSAISTKIRQNALDKFRRFLCQHRGQYEDPVRHRAQPDRYRAGLPDWLLQHLERYQQLKQRNWRPARAHEQRQRFWGSHTHIWHWLFEHYPITELADIKRQYILDYIDHRLKQGYAAVSINSALHCFHATLLYLQDQDYPVPQALLRPPALKPPKRLPHFLPDEQVCRLRDDFEKRVAEAQSSAQRRDALLDRAAFYLFWQGGLRLGEVEELQRDDLDLPGRKLTVRQGKGLKDRTVYLTDTAVRVLQAYLTVRGLGPSEHVFFYRNKPVCKDLLRERIRRAGKRTGVKASPHFLRHTFATQLLNAGCKVTSIQKLLGHVELNTTMIYAQAHDRTVAADYYTAMTHIEQGLNLTKADVVGTPLWLDGAAQAQLMEMVRRLTQPCLGLKARQDLASQMRGVLKGKVQS